MKRRVMDRLRCFALTVMHRRRSGNKPTEARSLIDSRASGQHGLLVLLTTLLLSQPISSSASAPTVWQSPMPACVAAMPAMTSAQTADTPSPPESLISALLGRYAIWLMLVACSSMLALLGAAAIVARMRHIAGDD